MTHRLIVSTCLLVSLIGCGRSAPPEATPPPANADDRAGGTRELEVPPETQQKWGLSTGSVSRVRVSSALTVPGVLAVNQQRTARISVLLEGQVAEVGADLGDQVRRGQVLLTVHAPELARAQSAFLQAHFRRQVARQELDRARGLLKDEAIQQKELLRRQADYEAAATDYGLAESQLHSYGWDHPQIDALLQRAARMTGDQSEVVQPTMQVRAPIDGRVIAREVVVGEHVHPDKMLFTLSDLSLLWAVLDARERDLPGLAVGRRVAITSEVYPDRHFDGRLTRIGDLVDEKLRTVKLRIEVPNPGLLLKPNMFVQGALEATTGEREALAVPEDAVQTIQGETMVFVRQQNGRFVVKPVAIGDRVASLRAVVRGLDGSETIVVTGAFNLKAELLKSSFAGE